MLEIVNARSSYFFSSISAHNSVCRTICVYRRISSFVPKNSDPLVIFIYFTILSPPLPLAPPKAHFPLFGETYTRPFVAKITIRFQNDLTTRCPIRVDHTEITPTRVHAVVVVLQRSPPVRITTANKSPRRYLLSIIYTSNHLCTVDRVFYFRFMNRKIGIRLDPI